MASVKQNTLKTQGGSLTQVLQQALQSDDQEQIEWILQQRDLDLITLSLKGLESKYVEKLLVQVLARFQQEK